MSQYDIAAGATSEGLNALIVELHKFPAARNGLFKGEVKRDINLGKIHKVATFTYDLESVPQILLSPPSMADWQASERRDDSLKTPPPNTIQIHLKNLAVTLKLDNDKPSPGDKPGKPISAKGSVTIYGTVTQQDDNVNIQVTALRNEFQLSEMDQDLVDNELIPELFKFADSVVHPIVIPALPSLAGVKFQSPVLRVTSEGIVLGTTLDGGDATDLNGFVWPKLPLFVITTLKPINKFLVSKVESSYSLEDHSGSSAWNAAGKVTASNLNLIAATDGKTVRLEVNGRFACYGELSGTGTGVTKAVMCPVAAAADAISDPKNWDKVITSFDIGYNPHPIPVPLTFTMAAPSGSPLSQEITAKVSSDKLSSSIKLAIVPKWSGSVSGKVLEPAVAIFGNLISAIFGKLIIQEVVEKHGSKGFSLPVSKMSTTVDIPRGKVTVSLAASAGGAFELFKENQLLQGLKITLS